MRKIFSLLLLAALVLLPMPLLAQNKQTVGYIEKVRVFPGNLMLHAKLAADSEMSSIHGDNIEDFKKSGKTWVHFQLVDRFGKRHNFEEPVVRKIRIKGEEGRRFIVSLYICVGGLYQEEQFSLTDRSAFDQEVLLGRGFLAGNFIIDPARTFVSKPSCAAAKAKAKIKVPAKAPTVAKPVGQSNVTPTTPVVTK